MVADFPRLMFFEAIIHVLLVRRFLKQHCANLWLLTLHLGTISFSAMDIENFALLFQQKY